MSASEVTKTGTITSWLYTQHIWHKVSQNWHNSVWESNEITMIFSSYLRENRIKKLLFSERDKATYRPPSWKWNWLLDKFACTVGSRPQFSSKKDFCAAKRATFFFNLDLTKSTQIRIICYNWYCGEYRFPLNNTNVARLMRCCPFMCTYRL